MTKFNYYINILQGVILSADSSTQPVYFVLNEVDLYQNMSFFTIKQNTNTIKPSAGPTSDEDLEDHTYFVLASAMEKVIKSKCNDISFTVITENPRNW